MLVREMPEAGWKVHIFSSLGVVNSQVLKSLLITTIVYIAIVFLFFTLFNEADASKNVNAMRKEPSVFWSSV